MEDIKAGLSEYIETLCKAVLVTIIDVKGSTPRKPGASMLVLPDGRTFGTVGGGCGEAEIRRQALHVFDSQKSTTYALDLTNDMAAEEGMVCGGIMEVLLAYLDPGQAEFWREYLRGLATQGNLSLVTLTQATEQQGVGQRLLLLPSGKILGGLVGTELERTALKLAQTGMDNKQAKLVTTDVSGREINSEPSCQLFVEKITSPIELLILGGGHIALPLCQMGKVLGYTVTVVDDRPYFANKKRFELADRVVCDSFMQALQGLEITPATYVVIVTRGHQYDKDCLRQVVNQPAAYIGMIGSRRRVKALKTELDAEGIPTELLEKVFSPIGLSIGAETPQEIAVSILGEIIRVRHLGQ